LKQIAIIGATASGKSDLALNIAQKTNSIILSIDSLSIYKEIDIASAKPNKDELNQVIHFGINEIKVDQYFSVEIFQSIYKKSIDYAKLHDKNLIIVGGSGFYLKSLLTGLSNIPKFSHDTIEKTKNILNNSDNGYSYLLDIDNDLKIAKNDKYRIEKNLLIYFETQKKPSQYLKENPPTPIIDKLDIFNLTQSKEILNQRIVKRTSKMFDIGLIDEIAMLEYKYKRFPNAMQAIGIKEILAYFDGKIDKEQTKEQIIIHTQQLAKRQRTFNSSQFITQPESKAKDIESKAIQYLL